jgi:thioredoxin-dependent peroxiredoxin
MNERTGIITIHGSPLTLLGPELKAGDKAPDFVLADNDLGPKSLGDFAGKTLIISAVPSLDTPTCDIETRRFNKEAAALGEDIKILTVSMDLPFAQKRWCGAAGVQAVVTLSDYRSAAFGEAYGILIKELHLLARAVFVVDKTGTIKFVEIVKEVASEPNYEAILNAARAVA